MLEIWKDIPGYEGCYQASDQGRVRSLPRLARAVSKAGREYRRTIAGCVLRPGDCRGYPIVNLSPDGTVAVHLLVARAFLAPWAGEVNHENGVKADPRLLNLEIVTKSENQLHAVRLGLRLRALPVTNGEKTWPSQAQAAFELTGDRRRGSAISRHLRGERPSAFGQTWALA